MTVYSSLMSYEDPRVMNASPERAPIDLIVVHHNATTNKDVALNTWLAGGPANTSAHYEITDNEIIGAVPEDMTAWHAGDWNTNLRSIGLEHVNSTMGPDWKVSDATMEQSARLIADIATRYGFPIDAQHVQPHKHFSATACPGGLDVDRLIAMAQAVQAGGAPVAPSNPAPAAPAEEDLGPAVAEFKRVGNTFAFVKPFRIDDVKFINGIWQVINKDLAGGDDYDWTLNGIPADIIENVDGSGNETILNGMMFKFKDGWDHGTIDAYDVNAAGIDYPPYGRVWYNADALLNRF